MSQRLFAPFVGQTVNIHTLQGVVGTYHVMRKQLLGEEGYRVQLRAVPKAPCSHEEVFVTDKDICAIVDPSVAL